MGSSETTQFNASSTGLKMSKNNPPQTLKELLQAPPLQNINRTNCLSPNGQFKYVKRQNAKSCYQGMLPRSRLLTTPERIRRPLNCFMVFSHLERKRVAEEHPELHNADLSKILGKRWKTLSPIQKQPYIDEAERIRQLHTEIYPDYKYQPRRKNQNKKVKLDEEEDKKQPTTPLTNEEVKTKQTNDQQTPINNGCYQLPPHVQQRSPEPNENLHSFPPTPEISPNMVEQPNEPVFVFDNFPQFNSSQQQQHALQDMMGQNGYSNSANCWPNQQNIQQNNMGTQAFYENYMYQNEGYYNTNDFAFNQNYQQQNNFVRPQMMGTPQQQLIHDFQSLQNGYM